MIEKKRFAPIVKDTFPITDGIFSNMEYELPMDGSQMDLLFFSDFGLKTVAPLVLNVMGDEEALTSEQIGVLASLLLNKNKNKWDRYSALLNQEYDPLHNYLDEYAESGTEDIGKSDSRTMNDTYTEGINTDNTSTRTDNLSEGSTGTFSNTDTGSNTENRYGMNSNAGSPVTSGSDTVTSGGTNSNTTTNTGTQTVRDVRDEDRSITEARTESADVDTNREHAKEGYHRGNIGNISSQKLIGEELELWKWNFVQEMLNDAKDLFTLPLYGKYEM